MIIDKQKLAQLALSRCKILGAEYADVRIETIEDENLSISGGTIEPIERTTSTGIGIRVLKNGAWGFAATDNLTENSIAEKAELAVNIARASALVNKTAVRLAVTSPAVGSFVSPYEIDPFEVSLEEKIAFLMDIDKSIMSFESDINSRNIFAGFRRLRKYFVSLDGSDVTQTILQSGAGMSFGSIISHRNRVERSFPTSSGQYENKGYELLEELKMTEAIPRLVEELAMLKVAKECPQKATTLLLSGDQVSLQIHESIGHALELDRVFGSERDFSGISFATPEKLGSLKYASDIVTVASDPTCPHGLGSYGYDDEGVPAGQSSLIENGLLVNYLSSRETAARINKVSTGAMRADGWSNIPLIRMTNINLMTGKKSFQEIISEIDDGIFMDTVHSWSIDEERKYFQFGCEIGWLIEGGKLTTPIKNPTYSGCTTDFWNKCSDIANNDSYRIWGTPNCGKGQPGQNGRTGQGASPARFENIEIGSGE